MNINKVKNRFLIYIFILSAMIGTLLDHLDINSVFKIICSAISTLFVYYSGIIIFTKIYKCTENDIIDAIAHSVINFLEKLIGIIRKAKNKIDLFTKKGKNK